MTHQTVFDPTKLFSYTVRTTKEGVQHGPLRVFRAMATPSDDFGRNGDVAIVDDTAEEDRRQAIDRVPETVQYCQKIPLVITAGTFTIDDGVNPTFTITISGLDDIVDQINLAKIPGFRASLQNRGQIILSGIPVTIADGTSDWPSVSGIAGPTIGGEIPVNTGTWFCFGSGGVGVEDEGILVGQFSVLNFIGAGVTATDGGGGTADITVTGGGGGVTDAYDAINGDSGSAAAVGSSTLDIVSVSGGIITTTAANGAPDSLTIGTVNNLEFSTINGQPVLTFEDSTRANKRLSVYDHPIMFADNDLSDLEWMEIGDANNADSSYIADLDGTVIMATGHCEDTDGNSKEIHLYINGVDSVTLGTLSGGSNATFTNTTINVNFSQGDRIRARAHNGSGGEINDTVVKVTLKWRG